MNTDDMTLGQMKEIMNMFGKIKYEKPRDYGLSIVVVDRGFVYIGFCSHEGDDLRITRCRNVRYWGTDAGLVQLINDGPTPKTKIDAEQKSVYLPRRAVISIHPVEVSAWKKLY